MRKVSALVMGLLSVSCSDNLNLVPIPPGPPEPATAWALCSQDGERSRLKVHDGVCSVPRWDRVCIPSYRADVSMYTSVSADPLATLALDPTERGGSAAVDLQGQCVVTGKGVNKFEHLCEPADPLVATDECLALDEDYEFETVWPISVVVDSSNNFWTSAWTVPGSVLRQFSPSGEIQRSFDDRPYYVVMAPLMDGKFAALANGSGHVGAPHLLDILNEEGQLLVSYPLDERSVFSIATGPLGIYGTYNWVNDPCIFRVSRDGTTGEYGQRTTHCLPELTSRGQIRGLTVLDEHVFAADFGSHQIHVFRADTGEYVRSFDSPAYGPHSIAAAQNGLLWIIHSSSRAYVIVDENGVEVDRRTGVTSQTHGDFTGFAREQTLPPPQWTAALAKQSGFWEQLRWKSTVPEGTSVVAHVMALDEGQGSLEVGSFQTSPVDLSELDPRYQRLEITFELHSAIRTMAAPSIENVSVTYLPDAQP